MSGVGLPDASHRKVTESPGTAVTLVGPRVMTGRLTDEEMGTRVRRSIGRNMSCNKCSDFSDNIDRDKIGSDKNSNVAIYELQ